MLLFADVLHFAGDVDKNVCHDIDECKSKPSLCDPHAVCVNTNGSFRCECQLPYWEGDGLLPNRCRATRQNTCWSNGPYCDEKLMKCLNEPRRCVCRGKLMHPVNCKASKYERTGWPLKSTWKRCFVSSLYYWLISWRLHVYFTPNSFQCSLECLEFAVALVIR